MENNFHVYDGEHIGKIYDFDGEAGTIVTDDSEYDFFKKDIQGEDKTLEKGDIVSFRINHFSFGDERLDIAKFVKKEKL